MKSSIKKLSFPQKIFFLLFFGLLTGTFVVNFKAFGSAPGEDTYNLIGGDFLGKIDNVSVNNKILWEYVLSVRLKMWIVVLLFNYTGLKKAVNAGVVMLLGFSNGLLLCVETVYYGFDSILIFLASVLPQYIFYVAAYLVMFLFTERSAKGDTYDNNKHKLMRNVLACMVSFILMLAGISLEAYINPKILNFVNLLMF